MHWLSVARSILGEFGEDEENSFFRHFTTRGMSLMNVGSIHHIARWQITPRKWIKNVLFGGYKMIKKILWLDINVMRKLEQLSREN